jgi:hypothetical protein
VKRATLQLAWSSHTLVFYLDRQPIAKVKVPSPPFSELSLFSPILNVALGGAGTGHTVPDEGEWQMRVGRLALYSAPPGGWRSA